MDLKKILEKHFKDLSEEASTEIETLFEAAISEGIKTGVAEKEAELDESNKVEMAEFKSELVNKLSEYTQVAVGEFVAENAPAIESEVKVNVSESVVKGLVGVLKDLYISVPESETDVVSDLEGKNSSLSEKLNDAINADLNSKRQILEYQKALSFKKMVSESDLTDIDAEKVLDLMEGVEADSIEKFEEKTKIIIAKVNEDTKDIDDDPKTEEIEDLKENIKVDKKSAIDMYLP